jgi:Protein of unknown function (DUF3341)
LVQQFSSQVITTVQELVRLLKNMSDHKPEKKVKPPRAFGWVAEYADDSKLLDAARKVRDSGYSRTDAFTPFPVHGIDEALGIKATVLPWFTLGAGATGTCIALLMQWWMNAYDYCLLRIRPYLRCLG